THPHPSSWHYHWASTPAYEFGFSQWTHARRRCVYSYRLDNWRSEDGGAGLENAGGVFGGRGGPLLSRKDEEWQEVSSPTQWCLCANSSAVSLANWSLWWG